MLSDPAPEIPVARAPERQSARAPERQNQSCSPGPRSGQRVLLSCFIVHIISQHRPGLQSLSQSLSQSWSLARPAGFQFSVELLVPAIAQHCPKRLA